MRNVFLLLSVLFFVACQKEEPDFFTNQRFVKFKFFAHYPGTEYWRINYTFALDPNDVQQTTITVPVEYNGYTLTEARSYAVKVVADSTTLSDDCYDLQLEQMFRPGNTNIDSLHITLLRKPILKEEEKRLRIELISNENFKTFMPDSSFIDIYVGDILMQPAWWDESIVNSYLGTYSDKKLLAFIECTGIRDFSVLDPSEKRYYAIMFKREIEEKGLTDEDGFPMEVPISG